MRRNALTRRTIAFCWVFAFWMVAAFSVQAQVLTNPGMNGPTGTGTPPGWSNCGGSPDVQIISGTGVGIFGINTPPYEGTSYLGLVSGPSYVESAGQPANLLSGTNYTGSIRLFRSTLHTSWTGTGQLRIYGGTNCAASTLLWSSPTITNLNNWQAYTINFTPTSNMTYIVFANYFNPSSGSLDYFCMDNAVLGSSPFGVNLVSFAANDHAERFDLNWELAGLQGNERLQLEWAPANGIFSLVKEESPGIRAGNWAVSHAQPAAGLNHYRLKVISQDGSEVFSVIREAVHDKQGEMRLFPNPAHEAINLSMNLEKSETVELRLIDIAGRMVLQDLITLDAGNQVATLQIPQGFTKGSYQLQARIGSQVSQHSVVIQ